MTTKTITRCESCEACYINGVYCHETGCPDAWRHTFRNCNWCGSQFSPEYLWQNYCDPSCFASDNG